ncbi:MULTISPECIES: hypothetical protein [Burkholderia]|uniref:hypothetical protein n=1 Tax=Burkholderia TaxID=32008 RepID=UPI00048543AB|nr:MULTISPECIES: hypothetical protein [Burkholderia]
MTGSHSAVHLVSWSENIMAPPPKIAFPSHAIESASLTRTPSDPGPSTGAKPAPMPTRRASAGALIEELGSLGKRPCAEGPPAAPAAPKPAAAIAPQKPGVDDIGAFVPGAGGKGRLFADFAHAMGVNRKGMTLTAFAAKRPAKDGLNGASTAAHGQFGYDAAPATDLVNALASGSNAAAAHSIHSRYETKVKAMLAADVERFEHPEKRPPGAPMPNQVDNLLLTKNSKGEWQYDKGKLSRIARDDAHPLTQRARDVLTAMSIAENKGKQRNGALYQSVTSAIGLTASGLLIGGSHGALAPLAASGHLTNAVKEALDLKKPFVEGRQNLRNAKAATIQRYVDTVLAPHDYTGQTQDERLRAALQTSRAKIDDLRAMEARPEDEGLPADLRSPQAQAGIYASLYDDARRYANSATSFSKRLISGMHAEDKAKVHKDAERDIVVKHILSMVTKSIGRLDPASLAALAGADMAVDASGAQRARQALAIVGNHPRASRNQDLIAAHTLLTDSGIPKGEAALLLSQLARARREKPQAATAPRDTSASSRSAAPLTDSERLKQIANIIGQPGLTATAAKTAEDAIKKNLGLRS